MRDLDDDLDRCKGLLEDVQMQMQIIQRGKHTCNALRLETVVEDLRYVAGDLEPHIKALREEEND